MKLKIAGIVQESIVDGPGIRYVIFTQGCPHNCKGCHNPDTHSLAGGTLVDIDEIIDEIKSNDIISGVTFSGGEPFLQPLPLSYLAEQLHLSGYNIVCYTGYTYEQLLEMENINSDISRLLSSIDILIDGPFILEKKSMDLKFKGSSNQRIIDVVQSSKNNNVVIADI